jgi:hypothetical protein
MDYENLTDEEDEVNNRSLMIITRNRLDEVIDDELTKENDWKMQNLKKSIQFSKNEKEDGKKKKKTKSLWL